MVHDFTYFQCSEASETLYAPSLRHSPGLLFGKFWKFNKLIPKNSYFCKFWLEKNSLMGQKIWYIYTSSAVLPMSITSLRHSTRLFFCLDNTWKKNSSVCKFCANFAVLPMQQFEWNFISTILVSFLRTSLGQFWKSTK